MSKKIFVSFPPAGIADSDAAFLNALGVAVSDVDPDNGVRMLMGSPCHGVMAVVQDATDGQDVATALVGALTELFGITPKAADEIDANGTRTELSVSDY